MIRLISLPLENKNYDNLFPDKCGALRDLVPFVQIKKMWKTPMEEC